jgi:uncharacterized cupin superfamily protein
MEEARFRETAHGLVPEGAGWFIVNARDLAWATIPGSGTWCVFESPDAPSDQLGIGIHVLMPGEPSAKYHAENQQEGFLVLEGECLVVVEGEERRLRQWDYFHCAPETAHITIGAGDGPCAILMVGTRLPNEWIHYPANEVAAKYGASARTSTDSSSEAYAGQPKPVPAKAPWPS